MNNEICRYNRKSIGYYLIALVIVLMKSPEYGVSLFLSFDVYKAILDNLVKNRLNNIEGFIKSFDIQGALQE